ncbi:response regulator [Flammeovirga sp. EKP202]|uniref:hybrid sensor histidine kinase/response regulator transcription factor n=1 Tax=Flammeovirga sp. EKP202 TaxID=2770592 RepID=UPI00165F8B97|nr:response regulator [Flammeovirga sp. EKP202]MBD0401731.1 response regulator [Flammeovirga sp. EKP202]
MNEVTKIFTLASIYLLLCPFFSIGQELELNEFNYQIENFNNTNGIADYRVESLTEDEFGMLWVGSKSGISKYDGNNFESFDYDNKPINYNPTLSLFTDKNGNIWSGSTNHITSYNYRKKSSKHYYSPSLDSTSTLLGKRFSQYFEHDGSLWVLSKLSYINKHIGNGQFENHYIPGKLNEVAVGPDGKFWIARDKNGIVIYDPVSKTQRQFDIEHDLPIDFKTLDVRRIKFDKKNLVFWCSTWKDGIIKIDLSDRLQIKVKQILFEENPSKSNFFSPNDVYSLIIDQSGRLWAGTWGYGIYVIENDKVIGHIKSNPSKPDGLQDNIILDLYASKSGIIWVGTQNGGINAIRPIPSDIWNIHHDFLDKNSLSKNRVLSIEPTGNIFFVGLELGGINIVNAYDKSVSRIKNLPYPYSKVSNIRDLHLDSRNYLWVCDYDNGLYRLKIDEYKNINKNFIERIPLKAKKISIIKEIDKNTFIICTQRKGIVKITTNNKGEIQDIVDHKKLFPGHIASEINAIKSLEILSDGRIYIGSNTGLYEIGKDFSYIKTITTTYINSVIEISDDQLLLGTNRGVYSFNIKTEEFESFLTTANGISSNIINFLYAEPDTNFLWIGTNEGVNKYDFKTKENIIFNEPTFFLNEHISTNCFIKKDNYAVVGGNNGLSFFNPDNFETPTQKENLVLTNILDAKGIPIRIGEKYDGDIVIDENITTATNITLNSSLHTVIIDFSNLDYFNNQNAKYEYTTNVDGKNWVPLRRNNSIIINDLTPGAHQLQIKKINESTILRDINIKVKPTIWQTTFAKVVYFIALFSVIYIIINALLTHNNLRERLKYEKVTREKGNELTKLKLEFFTNISHELRTPLTLISAPLEDISRKQNLDKSIIDRVDLMRRNVKSLMYLSEQLISFRKIESETIKVQLSKGNIVQLCEQITNEFNNKNTPDYNFEFNTSTKSLNVYYDPSIIEMILYNLLTNAQKFSKVESTIKVTFFQEDDHYCIIVSDQGIGISKDSIEKITNRFYQVNNNIKNTGAGIGLSLVSKLLNYHGGEMKVESTEGVGSSFKISFPKDDLFYQQMEKNKNNIVISKAETNKIDLSNENIDAETPVNEVAMKEDQKNILIVEDNTDLINYLYDTLVEDYNIYKSQNGIEAIEVIQKNDIDLILSDVMMPEMDGIELCKKLQKNFDYSHIPMIFLTAKTDEESQVQGLKLGADDYIKKPFNAQILKTKINNCFEKRDKLKKYYSNEFIVSIPEEDLKDENEEFLYELQRIIEENIIDSDLIKKQIEESFPMSQSTFYRKLKALTGLTITAYIRNIRIKKSSYLLLKTNKSISDIAYQVGYNDLKYFRTSFKKVHHISPSEYRAKNKEVPLNSGEAS